LFYKPAIDEYSYEQKLTMFMPSRIDSYYQNVDLNKFYKDPGDYEDDTAAFLTVPFIQETVADGLLLWPTSYNVNIGDLYKYNTVYSVEESAESSIVKPLDHEFTNVNKYKVIASEKKLNGEINDSWTNFLSNNLIVNCL